MYRMLIVDDEERIVNSLYGLMEEHFDFELYRAFSGEAAVRLMQKMRIDVLMTDISMPQMSGLELLDTAKRLWPKCHVLLLTAYDRFDYAYRAIRYDRVDYLLKIESYDEICAVIRKKYELLEQERREEELLHFDSHLRGISANVRGYFLKRIIVQGMPLPEQKDLEDMQLPIRLDRPALLLIGTLNAPGLAGMNQAVACIDDYLTAQLEQYGLRCFPYVSSSYTLWVIQPGADATRSPEELAVCVQEVFGALPQMVEAQTSWPLAILCADAFVPWRDMHALYQRAETSLERLRDESGMMILHAAEELSRKNPYSSFPTVDELNMLLEMLKCGKDEEFTQRLSEGLSEVRLAPSVRSARIGTSVSAVALLLGEAARLYDPALLEIPAFQRLMEGSGNDTGAQWVERVLQAVAAIRETRASMKRDMGAWLVERVNQYVESHYSEDITLTILADEMHYSPSYLSRFYKQHTGKNVMSYVYAVRLNKAKALLVSTGCKTGEIAAACGFCSTKYFNQVFRKATGVSAAQYREENTAPSC